MRAKAFRGRDVLRDIRLRRLVRDVRDMARRLRVLEIQKSKIPGGALSPIALRGDAQGISGGLAAEVTSGGSDRVRTGSANASQSAKAAPPGVASTPSAARAPIPQAERLALPVASAIEQLFPPAAAAVAALIVQDDDKVFCEPCAWRVPTWFSRDCITIDCPLKGVCA